MNYKLPSLLVAAAILNGLAQTAPGQEPKRSGYARRPQQVAAAEGRGGEGGPRQTSSPNEENQTGNQLVELAARDVFRQKAIAAKVRQRVTVFGQEVIGAGEYAQLGSGQQKQLRLEMKMQVGAQTATLLQVSGSQDLWMRRQVPPNSPKLEHVNLTRLRSVLAHEDESGNRIPGENWILLGGLPALVESLHRNFDFVVLRADMIGTLPVQMLRGELKADRLTALQKGASRKKDDDAPADQLPTAVLLTLGRADQPLPHFPYRIEYLRRLSEQEVKASSGDKGKKSTNEVALSVLEFYEVRAPQDLDTRIFEFDPGDEEPEDRTQSYLRKLQE